MKPFLQAVFVCIAVFTGESSAQKIAVDASADLQKTDLKDVSFGATTKGIDEILGKSVEIPRKSWIGFIIFSCRAANDLGKRILWIDAEVKFSNGYKREFSGIQFHLLQKGEEFDMKKIPFVTDTPVSIAEVTIKSVTVK